MTTPKHNKNRATLAKAVLYKIIPIKMPESRTQAEFVAMMGDNAQTKHILFHSVPNERKCSKWMGRVLNLMGRLSGVPDVLIPVKTKQYGGLYIEFKSKQGTLSAQQRAVIPKLEKQGYLVKVFDCPVLAWQAAAEYISKSQ